MSKLKDQK
jgi:hypothetical protein